MNNQILNAPCRIEKVPDSTAKALELHHRETGVPEGRRLPKGKLSFPGAINVEQKLFLKCRSHCEQPKWPTFQSRYPSGRVTDGYPTTTVNIQALMNSVVRETYEPVQSHLGCGYRPVQ